VKFIQRQTK